MTRFSTTVRGSAPGVPPRSFIGPSEAAISTVGEVYDGAYQLGPEHLKGAAVIDAGACIGAFSIFALDLGAEHVLAVEPDAGNALWLTSNVERAGLQRRWTHRLAAVGDPHQPRALSTGTGPRRTTTYAGPYTDTALPTLGLDCLVDEARTLAGTDGVLLKVDVEGAEYDLIAAATDQALEAVDRIVMEWHGDIALGNGSAAGRLALMIERLLGTHAVSAFGHPSAGGMLYAHRY